MLIVSVKHNLVHMFTSKIPPAAFKKHTVKPLPSSAASSVNLPTWREASLFSRTSFKELQQMKSPNWHQVSNVAVHFSLNANPGESYVQKCLLVSGLAASALDL